MHLRVISGRFKGRRLRAPRGRTTRPASGRLRQAVMNTLGPRLVEGARVLDLFAGTGAVGIEALSRGAASAVFVESSRAALDALRGNLRELVLDRPEATVLAADATAALEGRVPVPGDPFDLVFCDPPHAVFRDPRRTARLAAALGGFAASGAVAPHARWVVEHPASGGFPDPPDGLVLLDRRAYAAAGVSYLQAEPNDLE